MDEKELEKLSKNLQKELRQDKKVDVKKTEKNVFLFICIVCLIGVILMFLLPK